MITGKEQVKMCGNRGLAGMSTDDPAGYFLNDLEKSYSETANR